MNVGTLVQSRPDTTVCRRCPAKLNLSLSVLGKRDDGFHEIKSIAVGVGLWDDLVLESAPDSAFALSSDCSDLPTDDGNLVVQAARLLDRHAGVGRGLRIRLAKRIPLSSGLGGGSSNAASALDALNELWGLGLSVESLANLGAEIGSDVPFFYNLPSALMTGRGACVTPVTLQWSGWAVLVFAGCAVSTVDAYRVCVPGAGVADRTADILGATSAVELGGLCHNALTDAVFEIAPAVSDLRRSVLEAGAPHACLSGAGQTIFVLFDEREEANSFYDHLVSSGIGAGACVVEAPWTPKAPIE